MAWWSVIPGAILIALSAAFTVHLCAVMARRIRAVVLKANYVKIFRCELMVCAALLLFSLDVRFGLLTKAPLGALGWVLRAPLALAVCAVLFLAGRIAAGGLLRPAQAAKSGVVLGLALENGRPTADLLSRLDTARRYLDAHPDAALILTGGNPDASGRTEADAMRDHLLAQGVPPRRLRLESRAETTRDNFLNIAQMTDPAAPLALITSDYHMHRALRTARSAGFTAVQPLPAPSPARYFGVNVLWEVILEIHDIILNLARKQKKGPAKR